ncbi:CHASE2 domain-containing protein [Rhodoferax lacus]|nr:CHASE2 domain-containing protein [Rhodoferax lacus]
MKRGAVVIRWTESKRQAIARWLVGEPFWGMWGGRIFHTVVMAAVVAWTLQLFQNSIGEFVDTNVQSTLLNSLSEPDFVPPPCKDDNPRALANCISVVGVDDADFRGVFQQQSPLNPDALRKLFEAMTQSPPRVVAVDLDLSPASIEDWPAREHLLQSLQSLAKVTRLVMVCPQGYSTPEPGPLDKAWVQRFDNSVQFASADLHVDGLYFNKTQTLPTLGVVTAEAAAESLEEHTPPEHAAIDWHAKCQAPALQAGVKTKKELIRPVSVAASSFSQAMAQPDRLADRIVVIGGKWGINDQFRLRGQSDALFGVTLHAWVTGTELAPPHEPAESAALILELVIGLVAGAIFTWVWSGIAGNREHFAMRSAYYLLFFLLAFGFPLLWVTAAAHLAKLGLVLGAAGMVLSAAADSFLSSHEAVLEAGQEEEHTKKPGAWVAPACAALAVLLFFVAWTWGHSLWVCLACGCLAGLCMGAVDRTFGGDGAAAKTGCDEAVPRESALDLLARLLWTVLKGLALYWLFRKDPHFTTAALVLGFLACWCLAFRGWGWIRTARAPVRS